uniref:NADH-ubiquinone oxidoreductase chain 4 n=1 Tax=Melosira undulata TaxID=2133757 RepID=A0A3G1PWF6_9STRA|nr:NADH dehydrogenase subunit 4 [Melosira undulata]AVR57576.1 NADH dehydrogenase subunit 4 [Melosira undulata]
MILNLNNILLIILLIPIIGIFFLLIIPNKFKLLLQQVALFFSCLAFIFSLITWLFFNNSIAGFQYVTKLIWLPFLNVNLTLGIDGISIFFLILTPLLISLCLLVSWFSVTNYLKEFLIAFLSLEVFLIGVFCSLDLLFFYILFESVLIPMYLIIGIWGSRVRKIRAAFFFFLYTFLSSILMLLSILYILNQTGTTDLEILLSVTFTFEEQKILWVTFFISFATKIPMIPVHIWLPEAHVEAPTAGSVILAGILLKLGTYGFLRFSLPLFPKACFFFSSFVYAIASLGIIYSSFTAIRQTDFKKIIAYTSIAHMNLVMLGIFSFNSIGIEGSIIQSLSHGFSSSALFILIGIVYDRYKSRTIKYYGGLVHVMPMYIFIFLIFTMANIGFPGTSSFVGELLLLTGSYLNNKIITCIGATGMILSSCYALWLFNKISYGNLKTQYTNQFIDLNKREIIIFLPLIGGTLLLGIYPKVFLDTIKMSSQLLVEFLYV